MSRKTTSVVTLTEAVAGSGKTYCRCICYILFYLLLTRPRRRLICNYPVNMEALIAYAERKGIATREEVLDQVRLIPEPVLLSWQNCSSGPWEYLAPSPRSSRSPWIGFDYPDLVGGDGYLDLRDNWHLALDEAHRYIGAKGERVLIPREASEMNLTEWQRYLGEIRHRRGTIEFLTQDRHKMHDIAIMETGTYITMLNADSMTDPFFRIPLSEWFAFLSALTGRPMSWAYERQYLGRRKTKKADYSATWLFRPELFDLYNSYSAPLGEREVASKSIASRADVLGTFARVYGWRVVGLIVVFCVALGWFLSGQPIQLLFKGVGYVTQKAVGGIMNNSVASMVPPAPAGAEVESQPLLAKAAPAVLDGVSSPVLVVALAPAGGDPFRLTGKRTVATSPVQALDPSSTSSRSKWGSWSPSIIIGGESETSYQPAVVGLPADGYIHKGNPRTRSSSDAGGSSRRRGGSSRRLGGGSAPGGGGGASGGFAGPRGSTSLPVSRLVGPAKTPVPPAPVPDQEKTAANSWTGYE